VPSARLAFARLHEREALYAAGYFQAARQWGGALATLSITWRLAERTARFQYHLAQHMTVADPAITQRLLGEGQALAARGGPAWEPQALGTVLSAQALHNQVLVLAYNACFMEICVVYGGLMALALGYRAIADRVRAR